MLKVLLTAYIIDRNDISEAQMAYKWIRHLSQHVSLTVVTSGSRIHETTGLENILNIKLITLTPRLNYKRFDTFDRAFHPGYVEFFYRAKKIIRQELMAHRYDLGHHLSPRAIRFPSPFRTFTLPYVLGPIHGGIPYTPQILKLIGKKKSLLNKLHKIDQLRMNYDWALRGSYKNAEKVLISAPYVKNLIPDFGNIVNLSGVAVDPIKKIKAETTGSSSIKIGCISRITPIKGIELLLRGFDSAEHSQHIELHFYGKGDHIQQYKDLSATFINSSNIYWHGFVPNQEVRKKSYTLDIFALPSLREPAGIAVIEAMSAGLPVICIDAGGPQYTVNNQCGIKIPLGSKEAIISNIASAIDKLYLQQDLINSMGAEGSKRVDRMFSWEAVTNKMLKIYKATAKN